MPRKQDGYQNDWGNWHSATGPGRGGDHSGRKIMAEKRLDQAPEVGEDAARAEMCPEAPRWEYTMHIQGVVDVKNVNQWS